MLGVMGVAYDDVLNIRAIPGAATDIVGSAASTATNLEATGEARKLPTTIWYQVRAPGVTGWVNSSYVGFVGGTDDATAEFLSRSSPPQAGTLAELGRIVAEGFASDEPPSRIVQSVVSTEGDVGEVVYDVIGLGDDSVVGFRLHIFGVRTEDGAGFGLGSIERTVFCFRGLAGELCT